MWSSTSIIIVVVVGLVLTPPSVASRLPAVRGVSGREVTSGLCDYSRTFNPITFSRYASIFESIYNNVIILIYTAATNQVLCMLIKYLNKQYLVPDHLRPKVADRLCNRMSRSTAACFGHSGEERSRAVN